MNSDVLKTDLRLFFGSDDADLGYDKVDLDVGSDDLETVSGLDNLVQALRLRLLVGLGELRPLGHPRYGSRVHELIGELRIPANRELLRRYVRKTLMGDPRVEKVSNVDIEVKGEGYGDFTILFHVVAVTGGSVQVRVNVNGH